MHDPVSATGWLVVTSGPHAAAEAPEVISRFEEFFEASVVVEETRPGRWVAGSVPGDPGPSDEPATRFPVNRDAARGRGGDDRNASLVPGAEHASRKAADESESPAPAAFLIKVFVSDDAAAHDRIERLGNALVRIGRSRPRVDRLAHQDWGEAWTQEHRALRVGRRLLIEPAASTRGETHNAPDSVPDADPDSAHRLVAVRIAPGMAFGVGSHVTTRLCLGRLDALIRGGESVLDVGAGTGILAVAAVRLGAARAVALDIDPNAAAAVAANAARNRVADSVAPVLGPVQTVAGGFDLVVANIVAWVILENLSHLVSRVAPDGRLLLSGIFAEHEPRVVAALNAHGFRPQAIDREDGFIAVVAVRDNV